MLETSTMNVSNRAGKTRPRTVINLTTVGARSHRADTELPLSIEVDRLDIAPLKSTQGKSTERPENHR